MDSLFGNQWIMIIAAIVIATLLLGGFHLISKIKSKRKKEQAREDMRVDYTEHIDDIQRGNIYGETSNQSIRTESWSKKGQINAEIINPIHRTIGLYHVELAPNKDYGRQYLFNSSWIFSLRINPDTKELEPAPHTKTMDHPPSEVYEAIQTKELVEEVFGDHDEGDNKLKIGMLVLAACVALFLMAMAVFNKSQGG